MRTTTQLVGLTIIAGVLAAPSASAQPSPSAMAAVAEQPPMTGTTPPDRRWSVAVDFLGGVGGGPATGLEEAMRSVHLDDTYDGFFGQYARPASTWSCQAVFVLSVCGEKRLPPIEVARRLGRRWSIAVVASRTPQGTTEGYQRTADGGQELTLEHQVASLGALASMGGRVAQIGVGPALHRARTRTAGPPSGIVESPWTERMKLGFVARGRLMVPARWRLFLDLRAEYHFTGRIPVGPYTSSPALSFGPVTGGSPVTLPATPTRFDYWLFGVGPGFRF